MKLTGQILKENRERKGKSITEVAIATKINSKIIIAMEEGDTDILPTKTFLRGFVRSYAVYLGIDVEATLRTFQEEMGSTKPGPINSPTSPSSSSTLSQHSHSSRHSSSGQAASGGGAESGRASSLTPSASRSQTQAVMQRAENQPMLKMLLGVGVVILVILIFIIKQKMESYERESVVPPTATVGLVPANPAPIPYATPTSSATPLPMAVASPQPNTSPAAIVVVAPKPSITPTPLPTLGPKPSITPELAATPKASATPAPTPSPKASASPKPSATPKVSTNERPQDVILEALNTVTVDATVDGEKVQFTLRPDEIHNLKAKRKVVLQLSDGGAVNLIVNGVDRGVPGDLGKPKKVELK